MLLGIGLVFPIVPFEFQIYHMYIVRTDFSSVKPNSRYFQRHSVKGGAKVRHFQGANLRGQALGPDLHIEVKQFQAYAES